MRAEKKTLGHHHGATPAWCQRLPTSRPGKEVRFLGVCGQVLADGFIWQNPREGRIGPGMTLYFRAKSSSVQTTHVRKRIGALDGGMAYACQDEVSWRCASSAVRHPRHRWSAPRFASLGIFSPGPLRYVMQVGDILLDLFQWFCCGIPAIPRHRWGLPAVRGNISPGCALQHRSGIRPFRLPGRKMLSPRSGSTISTIMVRIGGESGIDRSGPTAQGE